MNKRNGNHLSNFSIKLENTYFLSKIILMEIGILILKARNREQFAFKVK